MTKLSERFTTVTTPPPSVTGSRRLSVIDEDGAQKEYDKLLDLSNLTFEEKQKILKVLERNEIIQVGEQRRINQLKHELNWLRRKGALRVDDGSHIDGRSCARCRVEFGRILNRGAACRSCRQKVCKQCRRNPTNDTDWVCTVCHKNIEIQLASGEWMNEFVRRPSRRRDPRAYTPSTDLVKKSIRRSWTISSPVSVNLDTEEIIKKKPVPRKPPRYKSPVDENQPPKGNHQNRSNPPRRYSMSSFDAKPRKISPPSPNRQAEELSKPKRRLPEIPPTNNSIPPIKPERPSTLPRQPRRTKIDKTIEENDTTRFHSIPRRKPRSPSGKRGQSDPGRPITPRSPTKDPQKFISSGPITSTPISQSSSFIPTPIKRSPSRSDSYSSTPSIEYKTSDNFPRKHSGKKSPLSELKGSNITMNRVAASRTDSGVSESSRFTSDNSDCEQDSPVNYFKQSLSSPKLRPRIPRSSTSVTSGYATTGRPRKHVLNPAAVKRSKSFQVTGSRTAADEYYSPERDQFSRGNVARYVHQLEIGIQQTIENMAPKKADLVKPIPAPRKSDPIRPSFSPTRNKMNQSLNEIKNIIKPDISRTYSPSVDNTSTPRKSRNVIKHLSSPSDTSDTGTSKLEFDDRNSYLQSDLSSSDIGIDTEKIQPEGDDYKLVFISSDSSKDSELNSSLDSDISNSVREKNRKRHESSDQSMGFIDENDWDYYKKTKRLIPVKVDAACMTEGEYLSDGSDFGSDITESTNQPVDIELRVPSPIYKPDQTYNSSKSRETQEVELSFDDSMTPVIMTPPHPSQIHDINVLDHHELQVMLQQTEAVQAEAQALQAALMSAFTPEDDDQTDINARQKTDAVNEWVLKSQQSLNKPEYGLNNYDQHNISREYKNIHNEKSKNYPNKYIQEPFSYHKSTDMSSLSELSYDKAAIGSMDEYVNTQSINTSKRRKTSRDVCIQTDPVSCDEDSQDDVSTDCNYESDLSPKIIKKYDIEPSNHSTIENINNTQKNKYKESTMGNIIVPPHLSNPHFNPITVTPQIHQHLANSREPSVLLTSKSREDCILDSNNIIPADVSNKQCSQTNTLDNGGKLKSEKCCGEGEIRQNVIKSKNNDVDKQQVFQARPQDSVNFISSLNNLNISNNRSLTVKESNKSINNFPQQECCDKMDQTDNIVNTSSDLSYSEKPILSICSEGVSSPHVTRSHDEDKCLESNDVLLNKSLDKGPENIDIKSEDDKTPTSAIVKFETDNNSLISTDIPTSSTASLTLSNSLTSTLSSNEDRASSSDTDDDATKSCCSSAPSVGDDTDEDTHVSRSYDVSKNTNIIEKTSDTGEDADSGAEGDFIPSLGHLPGDSLNSDGNSSVSGSDTDDEVHVSRQYTITSSHSDLDEKPAILDTDSPLEAIQHDLRDSPISDEKSEFSDSLENLDQISQENDQKETKDNSENDNESSNQMKPETIVAECHQTSAHKLESADNVIKKSDSEVSTLTFENSNKNDSNKRSELSKTDNPSIETDEIKPLSISTDNTIDKDKCLPNVVQRTNKSDSDNCDTEDVSIRKSSKEEILSFANKLRTELDKTVAEINSISEKVKAANSNLDSEEIHDNQSDEENKMELEERKINNIIKSASSENNKTKENVKISETENKINSPTASHDSQCTVNDDDTCPVIEESLSATGSSQLEHATNAHVSVTAQLSKGEHVLPSDGSTTEKVEPTIKNSDIVNEDNIDGKEFNVKKSKLNDIEYCYEGESDLDNDLNNTVVIGVYKQQKNEDDLRILPVPADRKIDGEIRTGRFTKLSSGDVNKKRTSAPPVPARRTKRSSSSDGISSSSDIERSDADASDSADTIIDNSKFQPNFRKLNFINTHDSYDIDDKNRESDGGPSSADSLLHGGDSESQYSEGSEEGNLVSIVSVGEEEDISSRISSQGTIYIRSNSTDSDVQIKPTCIVVTGSNTGDSGAENETEIDSSCGDSSKEGNDVTILKVISDHRRDHVMSVRVTRSSDNNSPENRNSVTELQSVMMSTREKQQQFRRSPTEMQESSSLANYYTLTLGTDSPHTPRRANKTPEVRRRILPDRSEHSESPAPTTPSPAITPTPDHSEGDLLAYEEHHGIASGEFVSDSYDDENDSMKIYGPDAYDENTFEDDIDYNEMYEYEDNSFNDSNLDPEDDESDYRDDSSDFTQINDCTYVGESAYDDREEELRGYNNRQFGFTLHTILEESCEESDYEKKPKDDDIPKTDPSDLEKYFTYGLGNGPLEPRKFANEESEFSDSFSETSSSIFSEGIDSMDAPPPYDRYLEPSALSHSRIEKYFTGEFLGFERQPSIRSVGEESELHTDESGSVGSDSEGSASPLQPRKKILRPRGHRQGASSRHNSSSDRNDGNPSDSNHYSGEDGDGEKTFISGEDEGGSTESEEIAFHNTDGQFDTIKRRKKIKKSLNPDFNDKKLDTSDKIDIKNIEKDEHEFKKIKEEMEAKKLIHNEARKRKDDIIGGDLSERKYQSRDSGFIGSSDDLLRDKPEDVMKPNELKTDEIPEVIINKDELGELENLENMMVNSKEKGDSEQTEKKERGNRDGKVSRSSTGSSVDLPPFVQNRGGNGLSRKDSFNNWSSDEETNLMMCKMRSFFKNMILNNSREIQKGQRVKSPQLLMFEARLVNLMKTVPGVNDEAAKEIVEYFSSEENWSDSYDSSDYTSTSDMEGAYALLDNPDPEMKSEIQEQISQSCQQIIEIFDAIKEPNNVDSHSTHSMFSHPCSESSEEVSSHNNDTLFMYHKLLNSIKPDSDRGSIGSGSQGTGTSPPLLAKVIHHIGNKLYALMHEVSGCSENGDDDSLSGRHPITSSPKQPLFIPKNRGQDSISYDSSIDKSSVTSTSFESEDSPTDTEQSPESTPGTPKAIRKQKLSIISERSSLEDFTSLESQRTVFASHDSPRHPFRIDQSNTKQTSVSQRSLEDRGVTNIQYYVTEGRNNEVEVWQSVTIDEDKFDTKEHPGIPRAHRSGRRQDTRKAKSHMNLEKIHQDEIKNTGERSESLGDLLDRVRSSEFSGSYEQLDSDSTLKASGSLDIHMGSSSSNIRLNASSRGSLTTSSRGSLVTSSRGSLNAGSRGSLQGSSGPEEEEDKKPKKLSFFRPTRRSSVPDAGKDLSPEVRSTTLPRSTPAQIQPTGSLPRSQSAQMSKSPTGKTASSLFSSVERGSVTGPRSARYHAPGYRPPQMTFGNKRTISNTNLRKELRTWSPLDESAGSYDEGVGASNPLIAGHPTKTQGASTTGGSTEGGSQGSLVSSDATDEDIQRILMIEKRRGSLTPLGSRSESMASVYSMGGEGRYGTVSVKGELQAHLQYNYKEGQLECHVVQCRDLAPVDIKRNRSDPYVKVYLLPDKSKSGKRKTKVKKHTLNPMFEEILKFSTTMSELDSRTLWISVWHSDMFGRNDFLGEVVLPLADQVFDQDQPKWYPLQERTEPLDDTNYNSPRGDLILALKFVPPDLSVVGRRARRSKGALNVLVKEAKALMSARPHGSADPICKGLLLPDKGKSSKQKTSVCRKTLNPTWNNTLVFEDVSLQDLSEKSLELSVWDHDRLGASQFLAGCRLNLGKGKLSGAQVEWMDAVGMEIKLWEQMLARPNLWVEGSIMLRPAMDKPIYSSSMTE